MLEALRPMLASKKFQMAILAIVAQVAARFGLSFDVDQALLFVSPLMIAIAGQAAVDMRKCPQCPHCKAAANDNTPPPAVEPPAPAAAA